MTIEIVDNSRLVGEELRLAAIRALEKCGLVAEGHAKRLAPVDTGHLRNSITHTLDTDDLTAIIGTPIGTSIEYAAYVELGTGVYYPGGRRTPWVYQDAHGNWHLTHGQRAQPYLKPAVADHAREYIDIIKESLRNA